MHAANWIKAAWREDLSADDAAQLAIRALFAAADEDVATGGPDLVRRIFPTIARIDTDRLPRARGAAVEALAEAALGGPERGGAES